MSNQLQIESYRISMRKLRTFYGKVTEFLNDDKISCLQRLRVNVRIGLYRRVMPAGYLYRLCVCLCILVACDVKSKTVFIVLKLPTPSISP